MKQLLILLFSLALSFSHSLASDDPRARAIMEQVDARDEGDDMTCDMEMHLIDRQGRERLRQMRSFNKDRGNDRLRMMFFTHPADVAGTGFLTWDYRDSGKDDDQWLYLPALRRTRRIASTDKSGSFMGSDFSYSDLTRPDLNDYDYFLEGERDVAGEKVWVIRSVPRTREVVDRTGYEKSLHLVRQDNFVVVRSVGWLKGGDLKYMEVRRLELIDGIWVGTEIHVSTRRGDEIRHRTVMRLSNVRFNQDLAEGLFTVRQLEQGM